MSDSGSIPVLHDPPLDGARNMARDEALMIGVGAGDSPATLRLYQWDPPTISLGYFQPIADYESLPPPAGDLAVVRRLTGGGAILHDLELTYSLALPVGHSLLSGGATRLYEVVHDAVIAAVKELGISSALCGFTDDSGPGRGPFFCFDRRHACDVLIGRDKVAGSAQRRTRDAVLQHGSIILGNRFAQQATAVVPLPVEKSILHMRSALVKRLSDATGKAFEPGEWAVDELVLADALVPKYAGKEWTGRV